MFNSPNEIIDFLTGKLTDKFGEFDVTIIKAIKNAARQQVALGDEVVDKINLAIAQDNIDLSPYQWLMEIDNFFIQSADASFTKQFDEDLQFTKTQQYRTEYVDIINLMLPLVYLDDIIGMRSFDERFITSMELAFLSRLDVPRGMEEARRTYEKILELPLSFEQITIMGKSTINQPFMAQMMFAVLIWREAEKGSELHDFQRKCITSCPDYLYETPSIKDYRSGGSTRPAFWMAWVKDPEFRQLLLSRGGEELHRSFQSVFDYEAKQQEAAAQLATDRESPDKDLLDKLPANQIELGKLLKELDYILETDYPDVFSSLKPGVSEEKIDKLNEVLSPLKLPEDLATLYKWHNGIEYDGFLFGFPDFLSIEDALQQYKDSVKMGEEFSWSKCWFTVSYESRVYVLAQLSENDQEETPIYYHDIEGGDIEIHHHSVKKMIQAYLLAYETGIVSFDDSEQYRDIDEEKFETIRLSISENAYSHSGNTDACYDLYDTSEWPVEWKKYHVGESQ